MRAKAAVAALGEGRRTALSAEAALAIAPEARAGASVEVSPDDTRRGHMRGELVRLNATGVSIRRRHPLCGELQAHFPRLGYRIAAVS